MIRPIFELSQLIDHRNSRIAMQKSLTHKLGCPSPLCGRLVSTSCIYKYQSLMNKEGSHLRSCQLDLRLHIDSCVVLLAEFAKTNGLHAPVKPRRDFTVTRDKPGILKNHFFNDWDRLAVIDLSFLLYSSS